jgi:hypothetical protein
MQSYYRQVIQPARGSLPPAESAVSRDFIDPAQREDLSQSRQP